jgi:hypothetical protein
VWKVGGLIPLIGQNFDAIRTISQVIDKIAVDGVPPLLDARITAETFRPKNGRVDLEAMDRLKPGLDETDDAISSGLRDLRTVDPQGLVGPVQEPFNRLRTKLQEAHKTTSAGVKALTLMPSMLGGHGTRRYALVVQNNAEVRATGGLPGAFAIVRAKEGRLTIGRQGSTADFDFFDPPVVKLTKDERSLYSGLLGSMWADTNFTPDFPRTSEIMMAMIEKQFDRSLSGVISVDPIALSYILKGTGPVKLRDGDSLTSDNAVKALLSDVYAKFDKKPLVQDAYFADAAKRVFDAMKSGRGDPRAVISGLVAGVDENRILINSTNAREQAVLQQTRISGALRRGPSRTPRLGLYLNDSTTTKLEYYLKRQTLVSSLGCTAGGKQTLSTTTVLESGVPEAVESLPESILGPGTGERRGSIRMNMRYYAPVGGTVTEIRINGEGRTIARGNDGGIQVAIVPVLLFPGQRTTVVATVESGKGQPNDAVFSTTPGIEATPNEVRVANGCD